MIKHFKYLFAALLVASFCIKAVRLHIPEQYYFDEVYHGFTASQYLHDNRDAYDPWAKNPPGRANEWTHPPLAKLMMYIFMAVFGENFFWLRIGSVLFGTLATFYCVRVAQILFNSEKTALLAGFLLNLDGLFFVQSRVAMNDSYFTAFMLGCFYFYLKWRQKWTHQVDLDLIVSALFLGAAAATKWTTLYLVIILVFDWIFCAKRMGSVRLKALIFAAGIPPLFYVGSYLHFFMMDFSWDQWVELQRQMWAYHSNLKASHGYSSSPWRWILNIAPVWMFVDYINETTIARIYNLGNPIILWSGLFVSGAWSYRMISKSFRTFENFFPLICYMMFWLPWLFSPRIQFFYHYLPAIPWLCMLLAKELDSKPKLRNAILALSVLWFIIFYPHLSGFPVAKEGILNSIYFALPGWR
jgi:dolichyl-phosphate-mannose-protein mannosyltransferase